MLTLIVPGLIWTRQALADLTYDLPLTAFTTLLGKGRLRRFAARDMTAMLAESMGIGKPGTGQYGSGQPGFSQSLPAAALRCYALREHPGNAECLCLDPIRLHFRERSLVVDDPRRLALTEQEAAALAVSLAPTFEHLGQLEVFEPQLWNMRLSGAAPNFQDLASATGRTAASLPLDPAYAPWRHAISEAQMLLHSHPINQAREAAGLPIVNSLWPWGGGRLPASSVCLHDALWSTNPVAQGIARLQQIESQALPKQFKPTSASAPLAIIDAMEPPSRTGDAMLWREHLTRFEADWLVPILDSLSSGRLDAFRLLAPGESASAELQISRRDLWAFWRQPRNLSELASA